MMMVKATRSSEAGVLPTPDQFATMRAYNDELAKAGALVDLSGLRPTSEGARIRFREGKKTVQSGPFAFTGETVSGYWIIDAPSPEAAMEWAMKAPDPSFGGEGEIELRRFFAPEDFASD
ncbi:MAG TPA: YciI family protein [Caulobacteraceae bacterium]|nr:YciI family protein [Caulobacteraceae bacterium]